MAKVMKMTILLKMTHFTNKKQKCISITIPKQPRQMRFTIIVALLVVVFATVDARLTHRQGGPRGKPGGRRDGAPGGQRDGGAGKRDGIREGLMDGIRDRLDKPVRKRPGRKQFDLDRERLEKAKERLDKAEAAVVEDLEEMLVEYDAEDYGDNYDENNDEGGDV